MLSLFTCLPAGMSTDTFPHTYRYPHSCLLYSYAYSELRLIDGQIVKALDECGHLWLKTGRMQHWQLPCHDLTDKWMSCENNMTATSQSVRQRGEADKWALWSSALQKSLCSLLSAAATVGQSGCKKKKKKIVGSELDEKILKIIPCKLMAWVICHSAWMQNESLTQRIRSK